MWDPYLVAGRVGLVDSISCCSAWLTTWLLCKSTRIGNPLPCWCLRLWTGLDSCRRTAHALYPHLHFRVGRRLFFFFFFFNRSIYINDAWRRRASAFYWPYKDGNIAREEGARPRLLWHIGESKQGGVASHFTTQRQMARLEPDGF